MNERNGKSRGYDRVRDWLNDRCGIFYSDTKRELLTHRLGRVVDQFQLSGLDELADIIEYDTRHDVVLAVMHAASTNYTYFFREPQGLDFFRDTILPSLSDQAEIRVWSAAASSGDEAYTLGIIAAEACGIEAAQRRVSILGTDISEPTLSIAERGIYKSNHVESVTQSVMSRYFKSVGIEQYRISKEISAMCTFRRLNLKAFPYPFRREFDVVFCRNVLYYFDKFHQNAVLEAIYDVTAPGGWLITSVTEAVRELGTRWSPIGGGIYRKEK